MNAIDLNAYKEDKQLCIVNNITMHVLYLTASKSNALEMLNTTLSTGDSYATRGYVIQTWRTVSASIKEANKID